MQIYKMEPLLIRMLSTGRVGTKFVAAAFATQGYRAFHENLYEGEPSSAIIQYVRMLGDMWRNNRNQYFALESDFARPYIDAVLTQLVTPRSEQRGRFQKWFSAGNEKMPVVIHTGHRLTPATPLVERESKKRELSVKTLILFRNPLKTIHAIYTVENSSSPWGGPYHNRPPTFFYGAGPTAAAEIWANTYLMAYDQVQTLEGNVWQMLNLERFNTDGSYVRDLFDFLGLRFDQEKYVEFVHQILHQPLRSSKIESARNSHIFHNAHFYFSDHQIAEIYSRVKEAVNVYEFDWERIVHEYKVFHEQEKKQIGFA